MRVFVEGVGLLGPGLDGWPHSRSVLCGDLPYTHAPTKVVASDLLPPAERRRTGTPVKLALAAGHEAFVHAGRDAAATAMVFSSSGGDGDVLHQMCTTLASAQRDISPTAFHNSVHNAAAGYWSIATGSREPSTSLGCHDASFIAGLLEAAVQTAADGAAVALVAYDLPYPQPLHAKRSLGDSFSVALVLAPATTPRAIAALDVELRPGAACATTMTGAELEAMRLSTPAARCLPLLAVLARPARALVIFDHVAQTRLEVTVTPCE